ncbi:hypothetical protein KVR01_013029 [Diaporthe batatas]|uniref:uncharacterized protein n=1 Tax=Diaporthe batatas TaxID=748121 RepID=UPI001D045795|nr:uncharacterized protein KVR01_013029 [Diaporthe batatas]KAG8157039.1 hypothetical protein KVR01_013029 [Diaporthe batatas]
MDFQPICANWKPESTTCKKIGTSACKNCQLITRDCKSFLGMDIWKPDWVLEGRTPAFVGNGPPQVHFGGRKYLWGNVPAYDVLRLGSNEGESYGKNLQLLFAASGDLRNVITTIARLPNSYKNSIELTINDNDFDVVARNVIVLMVALVVENIDQAADCMIHIWYSALIRKSDLDVIEQHVRPLIESVCRKTEGKTASSLLAKTWTFGHRSLRLVLQKSMWDALQRFVHCQNGFTADEAHAIRKSVTLAEGRKDYRDRYLSFQKNFHRVALTRFREDGLLLPFGTPRDDFKHPNPQTWPMTDNADPLSGWSSKAVHQTHIGHAKADIYGKLFAYLRKLFRSFLHRLSCQQQFSFRMHQVNASALGEFLEMGSYSRIESTATNPHATLITLFMNAVDETQHFDSKGGPRNSPHDPAIKRAMAYLSVSPASLTANNPMIFKLLLARDSVSNHDNTFDRYVKNSGFAEAAERAGATRKKKNTVVEDWPFKLKLRPGQPGAQDEFDRLICGAVSSKERYVEWKKV